MATRAGPDHRAGLLDASVDESLTYLEQNWHGNFQNVVQPFEILAIMNMHTKLQYALDKNRQLKKPYVARASSRLVGFSYARKIEGVLELCDSSSQF